MFVWSAVFIFVVLNIGGLVGALVIGEWYLR